MTLTRCLYAHGAELRAAASCSILFAALWVMIVPVVGYTQTQTTTSSLAEEEKLERDFTDPLSTLPQLRPG